MNRGFIMESTKLLCLPILKSKHVAKRLYYKHLLESCCLDIRYYATHGDNNNMLECVKKYDNILKKFDSTFEK